MTTKTIIAVQRHDEAVRKFTTKIKVLGELLTEGKLHQFPERVSISSFVKWENSEIGVELFSRSILYSKLPPYPLLCTQMEILIKRLIVLRSKSLKKANKESDLQNALADAKAQAASFRDQYSTAMSELRDARDEISRLKLRISRDTAIKKKVVSLRSMHNVSNSEQ